MNENTYSFLCREDFPGAIDGVNVRQYRAGAVYELPLSFAAELVNCGLLQPVDSAEEAPAPDDFPEDYTHYEVIKSYTTPDEGSGEAPQTLEVGDRVGMSAADAAEWVADGILREVAPEPEAPKVPKDGAKAATGAPKNKAQQR